MTYFKLNPAKKDALSFFDVMDSIMGKDMFELPTRYKDIMPAANVREEEGTYLLELAIPGLGKEDIKIEVNGQLLTVSYEKEGQSEEKKDTFIRREFGHRSFKRSFTLPETADQENITASYENGVLSLSIAKKAIAQPKQIVIA